jgi:arginine decarboxylase
MNAIMNIHMSSGAGEVTAELAAFDAALMDAGAAKYKLLRLSSVIPPNARIVHAKHRTQQGDHGRRLYVGMSQIRQSQSGRHAHAGIGWVQQAVDGPGLFVEMHDDDHDRLEADLHATLNAMRACRDIDFGPVQKIASTRGIHPSACTLVVEVEPARDERSGPRDGALVARRSLSHVGAGPDRTLAREA